MAEITSIQVQDRLVPQNDCGEAFAISIDYAISATLADNGDTVTLLEFQRAGVIIGGGVAISATLGTGATARLRLSGSSTQNVTAASTAAQANSLAISAPGAFRFSAGDKLELLIGGADISAAASLSVNLLVCHNPVFSAASLD